MAMLKPPLREALSTRLVDPPIHGHEVCPSGSVGPAGMRHLARLTEAWASAAQRACLWEHLAARGGAPRAPVGWSSSRAI